MDILGWAFVQADEFDTSNYLTYLRWEHSIVRSSDPNTPGALSLPVDTNGVEIVFLSFDRDRKTIGEEKTRLAQLLQDWRVPRAAVDHLLKPTEPTGLHKSRENQSHAFWYHLPIQWLDGDIQKGIVHVVQILESKPFAARILVFHPPFLKASLIAILPHLFTVTTSEHCSSWYHVHMILLNLVIEFWASTRWINISTGTLSIREMTVTLGDNLDPRPLMNCDTATHQIMLCLSSISRLNHILDQLGRHLKEDLPMLSQDLEYPTKYVLNNLKNDIDVLTDGYELVQRSLSLARQRLVDTIGIQNASYMRANTIALRRIAEQNQRDAQRSLKDAEVDKINSENMTLISYMTIVFLPPTFMATLFSMPFFDLDDSGQFAHINKIWIFVVGWLVLTALTIAISLTSRQLLRLQRSPKSSEASTEDQASSSDSHLLEPKYTSKPSDEELLEDLLQIMGGRRNRSDETHTSLRHRTSTRNTDETGDIATVPIMSEH